MPFTFPRYPCGEFTPGNDPTRLFITGIGTTVPSVFIPSVKNPVSIFLPREDDRPPDIPDTPTGGGLPEPGTQTPGSPIGGYKCDVSYIRCGPETQKPGEIRQIIRTLAECSRAEVERDSGIVAAWFVNLGGGYDNRADGVCVDLPRTARFFNGCIPGLDNPRACISVPITGGRPGFADGGLTNQGGPINGGPTGDDQLPSNSQPVVDVRNTGAISNEQLRQSIGSSVNSNLLSNSVLSKIPTKEQSIVSIDDPNLLRFASVSSSYNNRYGLYNEIYNFFQTIPNENTTLVSNYRYLNIFKDIVAEEVSYFLTKAEQPESSWSESFFDSLTDNKIILSLRDEFLIIFNNIHDVGNNKLPLSYFVSLIKTHLFAGTMAEFDPNYYAYIYNSQINDTIENTPELGETYQAIQAALGMFNLSSTNPNYNEIYDLNKRTEFKRMRFLLEDLEANIPSLQIDGNDSPLYLKNNGVYTESSSVSSYLDIGDGAGYYFSASFIDGTQVPLVTDNQLSSAKYIPPYIRYNMLRLLGAEVGVIITANSSASNHEFAESYDPSADVSPMYFKLNFSSIGDIANPNSVINSLSASYSLIPEEEAANHSRNYSFNVVRVNLDYRDPIIHYARDTSSLLFKEDEFNLRSFGSNRDINNNIILRNLPAAIILTPGIGSFHNPFNSKSKLEVIQTDYVTRSIYLVPTFDVTRNTTPTPPLTPSNILDAVGVDFFGTYESYFEKDIHGKLFTYDLNSNIFSKSYFVDDSYSNNQPNVESRSSTAETRLIKLIRKLSSLPGVSYLTWWDVFRRVPYSDIGTLFNGDNKDLISSLSSGFINNIPIRNVISMPNFSPTGIPEGTIIEDDLIIINESDR